MKKNEDEYLISFIFEINKKLLQEVEIQLLTANEYWWI